MLGVEIFNDSLRIVDSPEYHACAGTAGAIHNDGAVIEFPAALAFISAGSEVCTNEGTNDDVLAVSVYDDVIVELNGNTVEETFSAYGNDMEGNQHRNAAKHQHRNQNCQKRIPNGVNRSLATHVVTAKVSGFFAFEGYNIHAFGKLFFAFITVMVFVEILALGDFRFVADIAGVIAVAVCVRAGA